MVIVERMNAVGGVNWGVGNTGIMTSCVRRLVLALALILHPVVSSNKKQYKQRAEHYPSVAMCFEAFISSGGAFGGWIVGSAWGRFIR